jgi:hypothetical protein
MRLPGQIDYAFFWAKLGFAGVFVFITFLYFFSLYFLEEGNKFSFLNKFVLVAGSGFSFLAFFTNFIAEKVEPMQWGPNPILTTGGKAVLFSFIVFVSLFTLARFFKKYFKTRELKEKLKIQYILIGFFILIAMNIFFNIFLPLRSGTFQYSYLGNYSVIFFLGFTAYAIVKNELFGIKVILTQLLVFSMDIILMILPFFMPSAVLQTIMASVFAVFCVFGYMLINAITKEVNQKEILAGMVQESTKELRKSNEDLEQSKKIAEERAAELEKWYNLTIGREVRMAELKEKIKEMEEKQK